MNNSSQNTSLNNSSLCDSTDKSFNKLFLKLDISALLQLRRFFFDCNTKDNKKLLQIDEGRFMTAINSIYGNSDYNIYAVKLFQTLDKEKSGLIQWKQLLDQLLEFAKYKTEQHSDLDIPIIKSNIKIEDLSHCKKEPIIIIIPIETPSSFCYVVISKHGKVGLYDGKFSFLLEYDLFFIRTGINRRVKNIWITAAIYLADNKSLIITASDKSMMIYDASTLCHVPIFLITGIINVPMSMSYKASDKANIYSYLVIGDDLGGLTTITFKQPKTSLFHKKVQDKLNSYFWIELHGGLNEQFCKIQCSRRVHSRSVKKVVHVQHNSIMSCCSDPDASVVIRHNEGIRDPYTFKIPRGVTCFYYSETLKILSTGGGDGIVRLWEPVVTFKPIAVFPIQHFKIVDVVILAHMCLVLSFNKNGVLKVWDIFDHSCIQSINLRYPSFGILGKPIQFGFQSFYYGAGRESNESRSSKINVKSDSVTSNSNTTKSSNKLIEGNVEFWKWCRPEIVVTCCNHIAVIPLEDWIVSKRESAQEIIDNYMKRDRCILPPPKRMHNPRRPSLWDDNDAEAECASSTISDSTVTNLSMERKQTNIFDSKCMEPTLDELLKNMGLRDIMSKDFLANTGLKHNMNMRFAMQHSKQEEMRVPVSQGAPFTALDLYDCTDVKFSSLLPLSDRMKLRSGLDFFSNPQQMLKHNSCFSMDTPKIDYTVVAEHSSIKVDPNKSD